MLFEWLELMWNSDKENTLYTCPGLFTAKGYSPKMYGAGYQKRTSIVGFIAAWSPFCQRNDISLQGRNVLFHSKTGQRETEEPDSWRIYQVDMFMSSSQIDACTAELVEWTLFMDLLPAAGAHGFNSIFHSLVEFSQSYFKLAWVKHTFFYTTIFLVKGNGWGRISHSLFGVFFSHCQLCHVCKTCCMWI